MEPYEDNVSGKIDDARFSKMSKRYEEEQGEITGKLKLLRQEIKKLESRHVDVDDFLQSIRRYRNVTEITPRMVGELIDHIDVYQAEKSEGIHTQRIVIHYNCIGQFAVPDAKNIPGTNLVMETRKGVAVSCSPERSV